MNTAHAGMAEGPTGPVGAAGLSGTVWPLHLKPKDDELLSSWIVRLARAHSLRLHTFCDIAWRRKPMWNRDIDRSADTEILTTLATMTAIPLIRVRQTTLASYEGFLFERHDPHGENPWLLPAGVYHRIRRCFGVQFCPECLRADAEPYFRRRWRLAFITLCEVHRVLLLDRCPRCRSPITFHRVVLEEASIASCSGCGCDLRDSRSQPITRDPYLRYMAAQQDWLQAEHRGYVHVSGIGKVDSLLFFQGLRILVRVVYSQSTKERAFVRAVARHFSLELVTRRVVDHPDQFERRDLKARHQGMCCVALLLERWPERFLSLAKEAGLTRAYIAGDCAEVPFWLERSALDKLRVGGKVTSDAELKEIRRYVHSTARKADPWFQNLKRILNGATRKGRFCKSGKFTMRKGPRSSKHRIHQRTSK